jgi:hypothetical protein
LVAGGGARARRCRATTRTALGRLDRRGPAGARALLSAGCGGLYIHTHSVTLSLPRTLHDGVRGALPGRCCGTGMVGRVPPRQGRRRVPRPGQDPYHYPAERSSRRPSPRGAGGRAVRGCWGGAGCAARPAPAARRVVVARVRTCTTTRLSGAHGGRARGGQAAGRYVLRPAGRCVSRVLVGRWAQLNCSGPGGPGVWLMSMPSRVTHTRSGGHGLVAVGQKGA